MAEHGAIGAASIQYVDVVLKRLQGQPFKTFYIAMASPEVTDKSRLKQIIQEDEGFRKTFMGDEKV